MRAGDVPAPLYALAGEAFDVLAAHEEVTNVRGTALFNQRRDSLITGLPSFAGLADPLPLGDGMTIRSRSRQALVSVGFSVMSLDALFEDAESASMGFSQYVL